MAIAAHAQSPEFAGGTGLAPGRCARTGRTSVGGASMPATAARHGAGLHCTRAPGATRPGGGLR